jgi:hypothetical protein
MKPTTLTQGQRRYLKRFACMWCEQQLDKDCCGAIWERCSPETRAKRRADCLKGYRPRRQKSPNENQPTAG